MNPTDEAKKAEEFQRRIVALCQEYRVDLYGNDLGITARSPTWRISALYIACKEEDSYSSADRVEVLS